MSISNENIQVVEDEIVQIKDRKDDDVEDYKIRHMTPPSQDFSFLKNASQAKRTVHYDIDQMDNQERQPLRGIYEQPLQHVLRRRYIAHWGLPG